jgi:hypothetical protein
MCLLLPPLKRLGYSKEQSLRRCVYSPGAKATGLLKRTISVAMCLLLAMRLAGLLMGRPEYHFSLVHANLDRRVAHKSLRRKDLMFTREGLPIFE